MSLSNPTTKNPATRFIQWRGGADGGGRLTWYDKEAGEENEISLPFSFIVLDELNTITGYSESARSGFWSNEVRNMMTDELVVRTKAGIVARGLYGKISDQIKAKGAKYAKSVYIAFKDESGELVIGNVKIAGAALTQWIEFQKKFDVSQCAVFITDTPKKGKKGATTYFMPVFEGQNLNDNTKQQAIKLDEELQRYLTNYLQRKPDLDDNGTTEEDDEPEDDIHNIPGVDSPAKKADDVEIEDLDKASAGKETPAEDAKPAATTAAKPSNLKDVEF